MLLLSPEEGICLVVSESESRLDLPEPPPASISPSEVKLNAPVEEDDDANKCRTGASEEDDTD